MAKAIQKQQTCSNTRHKDAETAGGDILKQGRLVISNLVGHSAVLSPFPFFKIGYLQSESIVFNMIFLLHINKSAKT